MADELMTSPKVVGAKQVRRALEKGSVARLYIAQDADPALLQPLVQKAVNSGVRVEQIASMKQTGEAAKEAIKAEKERMSAEMATPISEADKTEGKA